MTDKYMSHLTEAENEIFTAMVEIKICVASLSHKFAPSEDEVREMREAVERLDNAYYRLFHARLDMEFGQ